jgi:hypothetical protein
MSLSSGSSIPQITGTSRSRAHVERTVLERDVCVIGGGASGTYSAVRLRDAGRSVVVVDRKPYLGGHTETYRDPATGNTAELGVMIFHDVPVVREYFARFGVALEPISPTEFWQQPQYFDFHTGKKVAHYSPPSHDEIAAALARYFQCQEQIAESYYDLDKGFDLPQPVPPDLLLPFGAFVEKHDLEAMVGVASGYGQGLGDLLRMPAIYVLKNVSARTVTSMFENKYLMAPGGNGELYEKITEFLGDDVLVGATVEKVDRSGSGPVVHVDGPRGRFAVRCRKLLVTCPPSLDNLRAFDLDPRERETFGRFRPNFYCSALVRVSGFPAGLALWNTGVGTPYDLPRLPGIYGIYPTRVPGLLDVKFGSPALLTREQAEAQIIADIERLDDSGTFDTRLRVTEVVALNAHREFTLWVGAEDIEAGFYTTLGSLQGRRNTFYNGATFLTHDSTLLWQFTDNYVLPKLLA